MNDLAESSWEEALAFFEKRFGDGLDLEGILVLIGLQELGKGYLALNKDQKIDLLHVAVCTLLEPYGYYSYKGLDADGWPHFERNTKLPHLKAEEQDQLMKQAIANYIRRVQLSDGSM